MNTCKFKLMLNFCQFGPILNICQFWPILSIRQFRPIKIICQFESVSVCPATPATVGHNRLVSSQTSPIQNFLTFATFVKRLIFDMSILADQLDGKVAFRRVSISRLAVCSGAVAVAISRFLITMVAA